MSTSMENKTHDEWPVGKSSAFYVFFIVFALGLFDMVDRQILASLFPYIKAEWNLTDTQLGGLVSVVNISIAALVVPTAYLVDKWSRKKMITIMGTIWSLATGACALAGSYAHLFLARCFIGAGEAGYAPASQSLLAASFPKKYRTTALSLASLGMAMGAPLGLVAGAYIATHWGWRHAFGVVAIPGFFIALFALFIKDYKTVEIAETKHHENKKNSLKEMLATIKSLVKTPTLVCVYVGMTMNFFFGGVMMNWLPSYLNRVAELPMTQASGISAMVMVISLGAVLVIGPLMDFLRKKFARATITWLAGGLCSFGLLTFVAFLLLTPGSNTQIALLMLAQFLGGTFAPIVSTIIVELAHPSARATGLSLCVFLQNILGFALGPFIAGIVSDYVGLSAAITILAVVPVIGGLIFAIGITTYHRDHAKVSEIEINFA